MDKVPNQGSDLENIPKDFAYTSQYFDYHRNMIIFFILSIFAGFLKIQIDIEKIAYISGRPEFLNHYTPFILFLCGCYCAMMFYPEWKECALPHRAKIKGINIQLQNSIIELNKIYNALSENLPKLRNDIKNIQDKKHFLLQRESLANHFGIALSDLAKRIESTSDFHCGRLNEIKDLLERGLVYDQSSQEQKSLFLEIENLSKGYPDEIKADLLSACERFSKKVNYEITPELAILASDLTAATTLVSEKFQSENRHLWKNDQYIEEAVNTTQKAASEVLATIKSAELTIRTCADISRKATQMIIKSERHVFVKTTVGGVFIPSILGILALISVIIFEKEYRAEQQIKQEGPQCLSDLTIAKRVCELAP